MMIIIIMALILVLSPVMAADLFKTIVISGHFGYTLGDVEVNDIFSFYSPTTPVSNFQGGLPPGSESDPYRNWCEALRLQENNGWVYVTGNMGCSPASTPSLYMRGIGRTNGKEWQDFSQGVNDLTNRSSIEMLAFDETGGKVYAGGWFAQGKAYNIKQKTYVNVSYIAQWSDDEGWSDMNAGQLGRTPLQLVKMGNLLFTGLISGLEEYTPQPPTTLFSGIAFTKLPASGSTYQWAGLPGFTPLQWHAAEELCQPKQPGCHQCKQFPQYNCTTYWEDDTMVFVLLPLPRNQLLILGGSWQSVPTAHPSDTMTAFNTSTLGWVDMDFKSSTLDSLKSCGACTPCASDSNENVYCTNGQKISRWSPSTRAWTILPNTTTTGSIYRVKYLSSSNTLFAYDFRYVYTLPVGSISDNQPIGTLEWTRIPFDFNPNGQFLHDFLPTSNSYFMPPVNKNTNNTTHIVSN